MKFIFSPSLWESLQNVFNFIIFLKTTSYLVLADRKKFSSNILSNASPSRIRSCFINFNEDFVCSLILHQNCLISSCQFMIDASEKYVNQTVGYIDVKFKKEKHSNFLYHFQLDLNSEMRRLQNCYHFALIPSVLKVKIKLNYKLI